MPALSLALEEQHVNFSLWSVAKIQTYVEGWGSSCHFKQVGHGRSHWKGDIDTKASREEPVCQAFSEADDPPRVKERQGSPEVWVWLEWHSSTRRQHGWSPERERRNRDTIMRGHRGHLEDLGVSQNEKENLLRGLKLDCDSCCIYTVVHLPHSPYSVTFSDVLPDSF